MTRKDTERLVQRHMQQSIPDKEALWAKIENSIPEERTAPAPEIKVTPSRFRTAYRVVAAAACLLLVVGGVGVWRAGHYSKNEASFTAGDAPMLNDGTAMQNAAPAEEAEAPEYAAEEIEDEADAEADNAEADGAFDGQRGGQDYGTSASVNGIDAKENTTAAPSVLPENTADETAPEAAAAVQAAIRYVQENLADSADTILDIENPEVEEIDPQAPYYDQIADIPDGICYAVTFRTTQDALLGPITLYVGEEGTVFGLAFRE